MRIDCEQCGAAYSIDDALITERGVRAQCPKCGHQKVVKKPAGGPLAGGPAPVTAVMSVPQPAGQNPFAQGGGAPAASSPFAATGAAPAPNPFATPGGAAQAPVANPFAAPSLGAPPSPFGPPTSVAPPLSSSPPPLAPPPPLLSSPPSPLGAPGGNPFAPPAQPSTLPPGFGAEPTVPGGNPFQTASSPPPSMTQPAGNPFGAPPSQPPQPSSTSSNPFGAAGDPFAAALGAPAQPDPFSALSSAPPRPAADPFARLDQNLANAGARPAMSSPGGAPAAGVVVVTPPTASRQDAFANVTGAVEDAFGRPPPQPADDPFAKLDLDVGGPKVSEAPSAARWHVRTKAGLDADVELPQLRDLVKNRTVNLDDEAAPLGEELKPVASWPILVPKAPVQRAPRVSGVGARSMPSFGRIAAVLAVIAVVGVAAGVYLFKPELLERTTDAGVNPLRRAIPSWERQLPDVSGTAKEHLTAGLQQTRLDTAAGYRKADEELRQALLLDIGNVSAIAAWVENFTHLPAVKADLDGTNLAREAIAYAQKKAPADLDVIRAAGALHLALGEVDAAQKLLIEAHDKNPADVDTTLVLAASHLDREPEEALSLVQQVRTKDPAFKRAFVVEGAAQRRLGDFKGARDVLGARLIDDPTNTGALKERAKLELDVGNPEAAIADLTSLLEAEDRDVEAHLMRAKIAYQAMNTPDALKRADGFLDIVLKSHDTAAGELLLPVLAHAAYVKSQLGDLDEALKLAARAKATNPTYAPALFVLGRIEAMKGKLDDAKSDLQQAVRAAQDSYYEPVVRAELARVMASSGDAQNAVRNYNHVIEEDPRYTRAYFGLAATFMAVDKPTEAMTIIRRAFDNDPDFAADRTVLTDYPTPRSDLATFADTFKNAKVPATDESLSSLKLAAEGMIRYAAGEVGAAEALENKTLAEDRFSDVALLYLGVIEIHDGRVQEAKKHLRLATETTAKNHSITRLYLARSELLTGELDNAAKHLQDLIDQEPTLVQAQFSLAMTFRKQHHETDAEEELKKVVKADPDYTPAKKALAESP